MDASLTLEQIITFLLDTPMFGDLHADGLAEVVGIMQIQKLQEGQQVFVEGAVGDAWYVVYEGQVSVTRSGSFGDERPVAVLSSRTCFGEMAVLDGSPRSATVDAATDVTLLRFPRNAFQELLSEGSLAAHQLVVGMARVLCQRQRRLTREVHGLLDETEADPSSLRRQVKELVDSYRISE